MPARRRNPAPATPTAPPESNPEPIAEVEDLDRSYDEAIALDDEPIVDLMDQIDFMADGDGRPPAPASTAPARRPTRTNEVGDPLAAIPFQNHVVDDIDQAITKMQNAGMSPMIFSFVPEAPGDIHVIQMDNFLSWNEDGYEYRDFYFMIREFPGDPYSFSALLEKADDLSQAYLWICDAIRRHDEAGDIQAGIHYGMLADSTNILEDWEQADLEKFRQFMMPKRIGEARIVIKLRYGFHLVNGGQSSFAITEHSDPFDLFFNAVNAVALLRKKEYDFGLKKPKKAKSATREQDDQDENLAPAKPKKGKTAAQDEDQDAPAKPKNRKPEPEPDEDDEPDDVDNEGNSDTGEDETEYTVDDGAYVVTGEEVPCESHEDLETLDYGDIFIVPILKVSSFTADSRNAKTKFKFFAPSDKSIRAGKPEAHNPLKPENITAWAYWTDEPSGTVIEQAIEDDIMPDPNGKTVNCRIKIIASKRLKKKQNGDEYEAYEIYAIDPLDDIAESDE